MSDDLLKRLDWLWEKANEQQSVTINTGMKQLIACVHEQTARIRELEAEKQWGLNRINVIQGELSDRLNDLATGKHGYVIVPIEPTEAMLKYATKAGFLFPDEVAHAYRVMIRAVQEQEQ